MDPFYIMPSEMYEAIIKKLDDPLDKLNLVRTNSQLEKEFHSKINDWQFGAVMPLLMEQYAYGTPDLSQDFRNCRLVSTCTCKVMDNFIKMRLNSIGYAPRFTTLIHIISNTDKAATFLRKIENHPLHRSPILSKTLMLGSFAFSLSDAIEAENGLYKKLVAKVGSHLSRFHVRGTISREMEPSFNFLKDLVSLTPKVRILSLDVEGELGLENWVGDIFVPVLPNLVDLKVEPYFSTELSIPLNFKLCFHGLRRLLIGIRDWKEQYNVKSEDLFPNLVFLEIGSIHLPGNDQEKVSQLLENFKPQPKFRCLNLTSHRRRFDNEDEEDDYQVEWEEFCKCVDVLMTLALTTVTNSRPESKWNAAVNRGDWSEVIITKAIP